MIIHGQECLHNCKCRIREVFLLLNAIQVLSPVHLQFITFYWHADQLPTCLCRFAERICKPLKPVAEFHSYVTHNTTRLYLALFSLLLTVHEIPIVCVVSTEITSRQLEFSCQQNRNQLAINITFPPVTFPRWRATEGNAHFLLGKSDQVITRTSHRKICASVCEVDASLLLFTRFCDHQHTRKNRKSLYGRYVGR